MLSISHIHHVAIICSNYPVSKKFYSEILGFRIVAETYREERQSYKLDLAVTPNQQIELFSFPSPPARLSRPEAQGLRHLAFAVDDLEACIQHLNQHGVITEAIRLDELTGKRFTFFTDPDDLPLELYQL
ncbi:glyoxylase I family protein [Marinomonas alcarazii]|uniref:Glyoxylase I family protein n=1 Tax=Marinomonas alcarazii TaxID=491949 RepID=A0A318V1X0_9GAMM|nr:VOC family protein [Marinomonas alcarazii]PYF81807.1 glyoxylase I family protein [Marinomonas alcarazii]